MFTTVSDAPWKRELQKRERKQEEGRKERGKKMREIEEEKGGRNRWDLKKKKPREGKERPQRAACSVTLLSSSNAEPRPRDSHHACGSFLPLTLNQRRKSGLAWVAWVQAFPGLFASPFYSITSLPLKFPSSSSTHGHQQACP